MEHACGQELLTLKGDGNVTGALWSHDGKKLAAGVGMLLKVWDARNGKELLALPNGSNILSVDWTPDDRHLVAGSLDGTVHVYTIDIHELMMLAGRRITRKLTSDECRIYLHLGKCSEPEASSRRTERLAVPL